jgi:type IV pilus assembly protein PilA
MMNQYINIKKSFLGFSIIELMVVVAIIGILASIATPIYINYTIRSHVSNALSILEGAKKKVIESYFNNNTFPAGSGAADSNIVSYSDDMISGVNSGIGASSSTCPAISSSTTASTAGSTYLGYIEAIFVSSSPTSKIPAQLEDKCIALLAFETANAISWKCLSNVNSQSYLPSSCTKSP